jgi:hypothetical protein
MKGHTCKKNELDIFGKRLNKILVHSTQNKTRDFSSLTRRIENYGENESLIIFPI